LVVNRVGRMKFALEGVAKAGGIVEASGRT
jgi:hypothetical protein